MLHNTSIVCEDVFVYQLSRYRRRGEEEEGIEEEEKEKGGGGNISSSSIRTMIRVYRGACVLINQYINRLMKLRKQRQSTQSITHTVVRVSL